jgi:hypothetical protein
MERFRAMLSAATERIAQDYFHLPVADADAVYRERVYCYELYHQLRCLWEGFPFRLGGEVDKSGSPYFQDGPYSQAKPDLLVHQPGDMERNLAVLEVKPCDREAGAFKEDLEKLTWFCRYARYFRGVFLVYGDATGGGAAMRDKVQQAASSGQVDLQLIEVFNHAGVGRAATRLEI